MKTIYTVLHKCVLVILAVQVLNMSLSNPDSGIYERSTSHSFGVNRIDSGFEYLTEYILGWDNYCPENGLQRNHQSGHLHKTSVICCCTGVLADSYVQLSKPSAKQYPLTLFTLIPGYKGDINPPPPKV